MPSGVIPGLTSESTTVGNIDLVQCNLLFAACKEGKLTVVQKILSKAPEYINCRRRARITPVLGAVVKGHLEVFNFLLQKGCDLSVIDAYNNTVLHVACKGGNTEIVQQLIDNPKCDKERRGKYGRTPLLTAAYYGRKEVLSLLVNSDCNISAVDIDGNNILQLACLAGHTDVVKYILSKSIVDIESVGQFGRTPILLAAWTGQIKVFKVLANANCNWKAVDRSNDTILHLACISRNIDLIRHILSENMVDIESRGYFGKTAALLSAEFGLINMFSILMNESCNLRAVDNNDNNIFHWACKGGHVDMVNYIFSLDKFDLDGKGYRGRTPIMTAAEAGYTNVADLLISKGCNPKALDDEGNTILHIACLGGHVDMVKHVIELKVVGLEIKNIYEQTAMQVADHDGYASIVALLKSKCKSKTK